jgi:phytoene dehydrogenase-like protein
MQATKTIIVGGGMAGMSCAMKLLEAGGDFLLVTDDLGGRIKYAAEAKVNFGAYFVMASYVNAKRLVSKGRWINPLDSCFHNSADERFKAVSWHTISQLSGLLRFYFALREFSKHYEIFKQRCLTIPQKEALKADPYLEKIFSMPAAQFAKDGKTPRPRISCPRGKRGRGTHH